MESLAPIRFIFIVGRGRSGTTLLQNLLDHHPQLLFPVESRLILFLSKKYRGEHRVTSNFIETLLCDLYREHKFNKHWKIEKPKLQEAFTNFIGHDISFETICKLIYLQYSSIYPKSKILVLGDKNPTYSLFTGKLLQLFPDSLFIHLVRNPKDNIVSHRKTFGRSNLALMAEGWLSYNRLIEREKIKHPNKFITLRYEDLVADPKQSIAIVGQHIKMDFSKINLDPIDEKNKDYNARLKSHEFEHFHKNLLKPIGTLQIDKWKKELSSDEVNLLEYMTYRSAIRYGYKVGHYDPKLVYSFKSGWARIQYSFYNNIIRLYYSSPMPLRILSRAVSGWLNRKFRLITYFNFGDYTFKD